MAKGSETIKQLTVGCRKGIVRSRMRSHQLKTNKNRTESYITAHFKKIPVLRFANL